MMVCCYFRVALSIPFAAAALWLSVPARAQEDPFGSGAGGAVLLTNNGFGIGGFVRRGMGSDATILLEVSLGPGKDDRELRFQQIGGSIVPYKRNYFLMVPVRIGFERRLFGDRIEDNFRPYVTVIAGPTIGWEYPYFDDRNANETFDNGIDHRYGVFPALPRGSLRIGVGGSIGVGAWFGTEDRAAQGVRVGYTFDRFFRSVQLLEPDIRGPQSIFQSPVITIVFGRLH